MTTVSWFVLKKKTKTMTYRNTFSARNCDTSGPVGGALKANCRDTGHLDFQNASFKIRRAGFSQKKTLI
jgi:hypothetical protein